MATDTPTRPHPSDELLTCQDCGDTFIYTARDKAFFAQRDYPPPRRCRPCRDAKRQRRIAAGLEV
jgi:hypothetical protein